MACRAVALRQPPKPFFVVAAAMVPEPVEGRCDSLTNRLFLPFLRPGESNIEAEAVDGFGLYFAYFGFVFLI